MIKFKSLYERMIANARVNEAGCWIWQGSFTGLYPVMSLRIPGVKNPRGVRVHRLMLETIWEITFPGCDAGHLCCEPRCINPAHLEVQTPSLNSALRRGRLPRPKTLGKPMIPIIIPNDGTALWRDFATLPQGLAVPRPLTPPACDPDDDDDIPWDVIPGPPADVNAPCPF